MLPIAESVLERLLQLFCQESEFVFLDTSRPDRENDQSLLFLHPVDRLVCRADDNLIAYLRTLQQHLNNGFYLAGWVGYEFGAILEGGIQDELHKIIKSGMVVADLGVFSEPFRFDHRTGQHNFPLHSVGGRSRTPGEYTVTNLHPNMTREEFVRSLSKVQEYISAGDTYQVNYTMKLLFDFEGSVEHLYSLLRKNQSVGYGAFIRSRGENLLSFSPELFFRKRGSEITVRPMKGTAKRGRNIHEEKTNSHILHHDIKNRSENVMIVDLLRNDLARLMHGHGQSEVFVDSLFDVESYESLLQMTSTIKAVAAETQMQNLELTDLFRALFPCGSITGAPKIRTMQIIDELEKEVRGVYTGAIGFFGPDSSATFNVPIRTVRLVGNRGEMGIGAGITHDSVPEDEWAESLLKGEFLTHSKEDFQIFETILYQPQTGFLLLDAHLRRLETAAGYFKFCCDVVKIRDTLKQYCANLDTNYYRVRLSLAKDGGVTVEAVECDPPKHFTLPAHTVAPNKPGSVRVAFSERIIDTDTPYRFYKTTMRKVYNEEYRKANRDGIFDYLFCNERGDVTEGCITNVFIYNDGRYITPPVECGLLDGVMRKHLMENCSLPVLEERIGKEDVEKAQAIYLSNSVRGVVRVELV